MEEYMTFGGLPMIATMQSNEEKMIYLQTLFKKTYITDKNLELLPVTYTSTF